MLFRKFMCHLNGRPDAANRMGGWADAAHAAFTATVGSEKKDKQ